jgi:hypothetical protein
MQSFAKAKVQLKFEDFFCRTLTRNGASGRRIYYEEVA